MLRSINRSILVGLITILRRTWTDDADVAHDGLRRGLASSAVSEELLGTRFLRSFEMATR